MKLIDLLVKELPSHGGWPESKNWQSMFITQDGSGEIWTFPSKPNLELGKRWNAENGNGKRVFDAEVSSDYASAIITREQYEAALNPVWNGEGLPPVGTECEWQDTNTKCWQKVTVVYASEWVTVIREDKNVDPVELAIENYGSERSKEFRPIRTEAESQRDEFLGYCNDKPVNTYAELYDDIAAHKIPGVTLVPTASQIVRVTEKCSREDAERIVAMLTTAAQ